MWRLNNILMNNNGVREEMKSDIKRYIETNDNDSTTCQNFWNTAKAIIRGDLNTPLSDMDRSSKQKTNREKTSLDDTL